MKEPPTNIAGYDPTRDAAGFHWDSAAAQHIIDFFSECLKLTSGPKAGQPFHLNQWQADFVATLYGWKRDDGRRRYKEALFFVPRKNGKTETAAGIALYALCCDKEQKPEVYSAAGSIDQASRVYEPAAIMVQNSEMLQSRLHCIENKKRIVFRQANGYYVALSSEASTSHGKNPSTVLFDELHTQPNRKLYDGLKSGMGARWQPLFINLTTAGYDRNSICWEMWDFAVKVRDGIITDPHFLPMLYQFEEGEDWESEDVWRRVNPNLGHSISVEFLREEYKRALDIPSYENTFRNWYLNQWTEQAARWIPMHTWDACSVDSSVILDGEQCWAGLDLSSTTDLTALVLAFPRDDCVHLLPFFWIPEDTARKAAQRDKVPYPLWHSQGHIRYTPGNVVRQDFVLRDIVELYDKYNIREIAIDPWNAKPLTLQLLDNGLNVVEFRQGYGTMSGAAKEFETLVLGGKLIHNNHPVLRWNASNAAITYDASGNIKPAKDVSTGRIDGIVASVMAVGRTVTQGMNRFSGNAFITA